VSTSGPGGSWSHVLPGTSAAFSSDWVNGTSAIGSVAWTFRIEVPPGVTGPPGNSQHWTLRVNEGGYLNRAGRITDYRVIWHGPTTDTEYPGGPLPLPTIEGQTVNASAPEATAGVDGALGLTGRIHFAPNPVRAGAPVTFWLAAGSAQSLDVFDVCGRRAARIPLAPSGDRMTGQWETRGPSAAPVVPGIYLVRAGSGARVRIAVIGP
jgi:hypothetical protein